MAGFGEIDRGLHGLPISHLADQNHVGRLTQRVLQGHLVGFGIRADFTLVHQTLLVSMEKLDGILNGNNVLLALAIAIIHHGRHGRGLAATGTAEENHQTALGHGNVLEDRRQVELLDGRDPLLDQAQHHASATALGEGADPKARDVGKIQGKIDFAMLVELPHLPVVHDRTHQQHGLLRPQFLVAEPTHRLVDLKRRWATGGDEDIRSPQLQ